MGSGAHPASNSIGTRGTLPGTRRWLSSPYTCKVNAWSFIFILPYASILWCLDTTIVSTLKSARTIKIKKRVEGVVRVTKFITGNVIENIRVLKVSRWCPLVLVMNASWRQSESLKSEDINLMDCLGQAVAKITLEVWIACGEFIKIRFLIQSKKISIIRPVGRYFGKSRCVL